MQLHRHKTPYFHYHIISLCGSQPKKIFDRLLKINPNKVYLAFDNDSTGKALTENVTRIIKPITKAIDISYPYGKDPNDWWIYRLNHNI